MSELRSFECSVGGRDLSLTPENCIAMLFRTCVEVDYLAIQTTEMVVDEHTQEISPEDVILRVFNNPEMVRWMAGYRIAEAGDNYDRPQVLNFSGSPDSFKELTGWNPITVEKNEPSESEMEMFLDVNVGNIDQEWKDL